MPNLRKELNIYKLIKTELYRYFSFSRYKYTFSLYCSYSLWFFPHCQAFLWSSCTKRFFVTLTQQKKLKITYIFAR